tara:strand:- start:903 stop:1088 length:186 start_codon:yes stop_codon:yes gene_type:complete
MDYKELVRTARESLALGLEGAPSGVPSVADSIAVAQVLATLSVADRLNELVAWQEVLAGGS